MWGVFGFTGALQNSSVPTYEIAESLGWDSGGAKTLICDFRDFKALR